MQACDGKGTTSASGRGGARGALGRVVHVLLLLSLALAVRAAWYTDLRRQPDFTMPLHDAAFKDWWGRAIVTGDYTTPAGQRSPFIENWPLPNPPLYSWFLAALYRLAGTRTDTYYPLIRYTQFAMGLVTVLLLYLLGRSLFSHAVGLVAAALYAFQWAVVYYEGEINQPALIALMVVVLALLGLAWLRTGRVICPLALGVLWGSMVLLRPESFLFLPVIPFWMIWSGFSRWRWRAVSAALIMCLTAVAVMAPVTFPHYPGSRSWFTVSYGGEVSFYLSNNEHADGVRPDAPDLYRYLPNGEWNIFNWGELGYNYSHEHFGRMPPYHEFRAHFMKKGWDFIRAHPWLTARRIIRKFLLFWGPAIVDENKVVALERERNLLLRNLPDFPLLVSVALVALLLAAAGLFRRRPVPDPRVSRIRILGPVGDATAVMTLLAAFALVTCATFLLFFVNARYRMPVYPVLALAGGGGLVELIRLARLVVPRRRVFLGGLFLLIYGLCRVDGAGFTPNRSRWHDERRRAWMAAGMARAGIADLQGWLQHHPDDAPGHYNLGILLFETGHPDAAEKAFAQAVAADPSFSPAWYNLGLARLARGDAQGAVEALTRRVAVAKDDENAWYALARARRVLNDVSGEEAALRETLQFRPDHAAALNDLGALLLRTRRYSEAVDVLRAASSARPDDSDIRFNLARALAQAGAPDEALVLFRDLLSVREDPDLWRNLAFALVAAGRDEEAIAAFRRVLDQGEKDPHVLSALAVSLDRTGSEAEADSLIRDALALGPDCALCWFNWSRILDRRGLRAQARQACEAALAREADLDAALLALGLDKLREGAQSDALDFFTRAVHANPANGYAWYNRAMLCRRLGRPDDALEAYRRAVQCRSAPADAWRSLALLYRELGRNSDAVDAFREALKRFPGDPDLYFGLGAALMEEARLTEARDALTRACALAPWDGNAWNLLGLTAHRLSDHSLAAQAFLRAWRRLPESRRPELLRMRAIALLDGGLCREAADLLRQLTPAAPFSADAGVWYDLARALTCSGQDDAASQACDTALRLDHAHVPALLLMADLRRRQGDPEGAAASLRLALERDSANPDALFSMGLLARDAGNLDDAVRWFRQAIEADPHRPSFHLNLGLALEAGGHLHDAQAAYRRAVELDPNLALARLKLADRLRESGQLDEALQHYAAARSLDPHNPDAPKNQGYLLLNRGDAHAAEQAFRAATLLRPDDPDSLLGLADALTHTRPADTDEAVSLYRRAATLRPDDPRPWKNLGFLFARHGRLNDAADAFRDALQRNPNDADVACGLADVLFALGRNDEAESQYQKALAIRPDFVLALNNYGNLLTRAGRHDEALHCYRRAWELDPNLPDVLFNLGRALQRKGALDEAIPLLERAVTLRPDDSRARLTLAQALTSAGRTAEALSHARRVALERPDWEQARQLLDSLSRTGQTSGTDSR